VVPDSGERRRDTGAASARSLLLTVLGEFVLPRDAPAWTGALVTALAEVGVEEKAARQALSRTAAEGLLSSEREGRRVPAGVSTQRTRLLVQGTERIYGFGRRVEAWDGRWLVVAVSVPEAQRQLRHRLRTRLTWAGLGSPMPGLWVTPDVDKEKEVGAVVDELGVEAHSFTGPFGQIGDEQRVVASAWALDDVERRYRHFLDGAGRGLRRAGAAGPGVAAFPVPRPRAAAPAAARHLAWRRGGGRLPPAARRLARRRAGALGGAVHLGGRPLVTAAELRAAGRHAFVHAACPPPTGATGTRSELRSGRSRTRPACC
jgi:phenylacetic acid degradation operon negative regulatory protein